MVGKALTVAWFTLSFLLADQSRLPFIISGSSTASIIQGSDFEYLGAIRMPPNGAGVDTSFSAGGMTGRKVGGDLHLFVYGNPVTSDPEPPDLYELDITGVTPQIPVSNTSMSSPLVPRATLYKNWGNIYHNKRIAWSVLGSAYVKLTGLSGINHSLYWHEGLQQIFWGYDYNYTDSAKSTIGFSTLDDLSTGASTAYGPCQYEATGKDGALMPGAREHFISAHPISGKMLTSAVTKSGADTVPPGPVLFGGNDFPTPATTDCSTTPTDISVPDRYLNYYAPTGLAYDGSHTGDLTSFRYDGILGYPYEYWPATFVDHRVDPAQNSGIGSWSDVDGCGAFVWLELTHKRGVLYLCTLMATSDIDPTHSTAAHEWYTNNGQISMYTSTTTGFSVPHVIEGTTSKARSVLSSVETGVGLGSAQTITHYSNGETVTGLSSGAHGVLSTSSEYSSNFVELIFTSHVGTFTVGEIVSGGTSGGRSKVTVWTPGTETMEADFFPDFVDGETITDLTSSATATISGKPAGIRNSFLRHTPVCIHGHTMAGSVTGPGTTASTPAFIIYNPDNLTNVKNGGAVDWQQNSHEIVDMKATYNTVHAPQADLAANGINGYYFDTVTNNLYLNAVHADCTRVSDCTVFSETLIHVFHINDSAPKPKPTPMMPLALVACAAPLALRRRYQWREGNVASAPPKP